MGYSLAMIEIRQTEHYAKWFSSLRDKTAQAKITIRIRRLSMGNAGDVKPIGGGLSELRIDYGGGYRIYFVQRGESWVILLAGGDKSTQAKDIKLAHELVKII
jgi:putative addiction module killer protein